MKLRHRYLLLAVLTLNYFPLQVFASTNCEPIDPAMMTRVENEMKLVISSQTVKTYIIAGQDSALEYITPSNYSTYEIQTADRCATVQLVNQNANAPKVIVTAHKCQFTSGVFVQQGYDKVATKFESILSSSDLISHFSCSTLSSNVISSFQLMAMENGKFDLVAGTYANGQYSPVNGLEYLIALDASGNQQWTFLGGPGGGASVGNH